MKGLSLETPSVKKLNKLKKEITFWDLWEGQGNDFIKLVKDSENNILAVYNKEKDITVINEIGDLKELEIMLLIKEYKEKKKK